MTATKATPTPPARPRGAALAALVPGRRAAVLALGWLAALLAMLAPAQAWASPDSPRTAIVALGDSIASGEGGRWLGNGTDPLGTRSGTDRAAHDCDVLGFCDYDPERVYGDSEEDECHRSDVAPIRSAHVAVDERVLLACSGARARNLWPSSLGGRPHFGEPPQADQLVPLARQLDVRMVVVTVGANDVGFGDLVAGCALDWARSDPAAPELCHGYAQDEIDALLPSMRRGVGRASRVYGERWAPPATARATTASSSAATPPPTPPAAGSATPRTAGAG